MINPMQGPLPGLPQPDLGSTVSGANQPGGERAGFLDTLHAAVSQVGQLQSEADTQVASMLSGGGQDVHSAMIAVEKANLTFELMVQVRNKIISAYQEVSRIPF
ncbi:MAG: flagellar hook-basal body complex protein FliE [Candidatus Acidiferrales bacterium]|jgi:flagellar hook-basal body complex protein FliE